MANNSSHAIYDEREDCTFTKAILRYFGGSIFFIGIISTALSICVFTRKPLRRKSCCFYFLILAISDLIHLIMMTVENFRYIFHKDIISLHSVICKIVIFLIYLSNHSSNIVLTLASFDRFLLIYWPQRSKYYCNLSKAKLFVLVSIVLLTITNGHLLIGFEKLTLKDEYNAESYDCNINEKNNVYNRIFRVYDTYIESILFVVIPFIIMFICSTLIIFKIIETRKTICYNRRGKYYYYKLHTKQQNGCKKAVNIKNRIILREKDIQLCCMLIGTTLAFIFLCLPTEINDTLIYTDHYRSCANWLRKVVFMLMQQIYYAGHFYVYILTGPLFRRHLYSIICFQNQAMRRSRNKNFSIKLFSSFKSKCREHQDQTIGRDHNIKLVSSSTNINIQNCQLTKTIDLDDTN